MMTHNILSIKAASIIANKIDCESIPYPVYSRPRHKIIFSGLDTRVLEFIRDISFRSSLEFESFSLNRDKLTLEISLRAWDLNKIFSTDTYHDWKKSICNRFSSDVAEMFTIAENKARLQEQKLLAVYEFRVKADGKNMNVHLHVASMFPGRDTGPHPGIYLVRSNRISLTNLTPAQYETIKTILSKSQILKAADCWGDRLADELFHRIDIGFPSHIGNHEESDFIKLVQNPYYISLKKELCGAFPELQEQFHVEEERAASKQAQYQLEYDFAIKDDAAFAKLSKIYACRAPGFSLFERREQLQKVTLDQSAASGKSILKFNRSFNFK